VLTFGVFLSQNEFQEISFGRFDAQGTTSQITFHHGQQRLRHFLVSLHVSAGAYAGGEFVFEFCVPADYPIIAPAVRAVTKILHPRIDIQSGRLKCDILESDWKSVCTVNMVIFSLESMFLEPEAGDEPLNAHAAALLHTNSTAFQAQVQAVIAEHALVEDFDLSSRIFLTRLVKTHACDECTASSPTSASNATSSPRYQARLNAQDVFFAGGTYHRMGSLLGKSKRPREPENDILSSKIRLLHLGDSVGDRNRSETCTDVDSDDELSSVDTSPAFNASSMTTHVEPYQLFSSEPPNSADSGFGRPVASFRSAHSTNIAAAQSASAQQRQMMNAWRVRWHPSVSVATYSCRERSMANVFFNCTICYI
jgi:ubiquitin-protein ligase